MLHMLWVVRQQQSCFPASQSREQRSQKAAPIATAHLRLDALPAAQLLLQLAFALGSLLAGGAHDLSEGEARRPAEFISHGLARAAALVRVGRQLFCLPSPAPCITPQRHAFPRPTAAASAHLEHLCTQAEAHLVAQEPRHCDAGGGKGQHGGCAAAGGVHDAPPRFGAAVQVRHGVAWVGR